MTSFLCLSVYLVDVCNDMDTKSHDKHLRSDTVVPEKSEVNKLSTVGESSGNLELFSLSGKPLAKLEEQSLGECTKVESRKCLKDKETEDKKYTVDDKDVEALRNNLPNDFGGSNYDNKVPFYNSEIMDAKATNGSSVTVKECDIGLKNHSIGGSISTMNPERESKQTDMQLENGENQMASRY